MPDKRREELWCMECENYVQFMLDYDLDGCHTLDCPKCGHHHYRVIKKGKITSERWDVDPTGRPTGGMIWTVTSSTASTISMDDWGSTTATADYTAYTTWNTGS